MFFVFLFWLLWWAASRKRSRIARSSQFICPLAGVPVVWEAAGIGTLAFVSWMYPGNLSTKGTGLSSLVTDWKNPKQGWKKLQNREQNGFSFLWSGLYEWTEHQTVWWTEVTRIILAWKQLFYFLRKKKKQTLLNVLLIFSRVFKKVHLFRRAGPLLKEGDGYSPWLTTDICALV